MHHRLVLILALCLLNAIDNSARPLSSNVDLSRVRRDSAKETKEEHKTKEEDKKDDDDDDEQFFLNDQFFLFESDIILSSNEIKQIQLARGFSEEGKGTATADKGREKRDLGSGMIPSPALVPTQDSKTTLSRKWPNCRVPIKYSQTLSHAMRVSFMKAMELWQGATCIVFVQALPVDKDYLILTRGSICSSSVGRRGGVQEVTLADNCDEVGHAAHELGHAIGLWHEHSRLDRDEYIEIHKENIKSESDYVNFDIISRNTLDEVPDVGYDIQSIMHYSPFAFAKSKEPGGETITLKEDADLPELGCLNTMEMGQRQGLSYKDKKRASALYGCDFDAEEPACITPTATQTEVTTEAETTTMPTPSMTTPTARSSVKLNSGNILAFSFGGDQEQGIICMPSPGCSPLPCQNRGINTCHRIEYQFQIVNHQSISSRRIKSGNTVLLRSVNTPNRWLDCSDATRCVITPCTEDNPDDGANSSYISNCSRHHFQVFGVNRGLRKLLTNQHKLQFKYNNEDGYLNCNGKRCHLLQDGVCPKKSVAPFMMDQDGECPPEGFDVTLLSEI